MVDEKQTADWDYDITEETDVQEKDTLSYEIAYYPADITLKGYLDKWNDKQLVIPDFQRNFVWDQTRASKLIESFLLGLPVPGVFLYKVRDTKKLQVIDGHQRIMSAIKFFNNDFEGKEFRLKKVGQEWDGKRFMDLVSCPMNILHNYY